MRRVRMHMVVAGQRVLADGLRGRAVVDDAAVAQDDGAVDQRLQGAEFVEHEEHGGAGGDLFAQGAGQYALAGEVDAGHRLVHDQ